MNVEEIRSYALQKEEVTESFPFGEETLVFKTNDKIFLLIGLDNDDLRFNAKCDPDKAVELREEYPDNILPGYHMNKKHWNTIVVHGLKNSLVKELIDHSYSLVVPKRKKK
ncbi:MAG: MmcQ/YjbR family DNA-binding protein [Ferruginibacter sp.]